MKFARLIVACAVALGATVPALAQYGPAPTDTGSPQAGSMTTTGGSQIFNIAPQHGSNESGTVTLGPGGRGKTVVSIDLTGAPAEPQPAHIHKGTCANLDPAPLYPLSNVVQRTLEDRRQRLARDLDRRRPRGQRAPIVDRSQGLRRVWRLGVG